METAFWAESVKRERRPAVAQFLSNSEVLWSNICCGIFVTTHFNPERLTPPKAAC